MGSTQDDIITHIYDKLSYQTGHQIDIEADAFDQKKEAFDRKSVNHAYDWLLPLSPPVFKDVRETANG